MDTTTELYTILSIVLTFAALTGYLNYRFVRLAPTIAIMTGSLLLSLILLVCNSFGWLSTVIQPAIADIGKIDFHELLMNSMLSFLLFAGGLTVDVQYLYQQRLEITVLASISTVISSLLIGVSIYEILNITDIHLSLLYCLLFGALISPTDPIAVLAMCKEIKAPQQLTVLLAGESLFNDGVGIVLFTTLYGLLMWGGQASIQNISILLLQQAVGGLLYGLLLGWIGSHLIKSISDYKIIILITMAITTGGYIFAQAINISGPLAMVVAGICIGRRWTSISNEKVDTSKNAQRDTNIYLNKNDELRVNAQEKLNEFWEVVDEVLNALLFSLLGLVLLFIHLGKKEILSGLVAIPLVLVVRFITVAIPFSLFKLKRHYNSHVVKILTWGGLRGGLAVALALALPEGDARDYILTMTYAVVVFAIIVQGLTVKSLVKMSR